MIDALIIRITRIETRAAVRLQALAAWWASSAVGRGLRAFARREEKSGGNGWRK